MMQGGGIMWERDGELLEWCMARYCDNFGAEWLTPFANNFVPAAPSFDKELEALLAGEEPLVLWSNLSPRKVAKGSKADVQRCIANSLEALAHEGLDLREATEAGKGSQQAQKEEEEEEGGKEKMPDTMAGAAMRAATPAARKAPTGGAKGLASPAKKGSPTKPASKCRGCPTPRYKAPMQQDFSDKELACLLAPRWVEAVVDIGVEAGVVLKETKGKATMDLVTCQAFKEEWGACNKCWVDNNPEGCWYHMGALPCFKCVAMKRLCTLNGTKIWEHGNTPDLTVEKTYYRAVLVRRARAVVEKVREAEAREEAISLSKKSLVLPTCQEDEERGSSKGKHKASLSLLPTDKGKKRARVVSPRVVTPKVESEGDEENKVHCLGMAIETSKAAPGMENLAGPSHQAEAPQNVGALHEEMEQDKEEAEVGPEAAPQAQLWRWGSSQWSWLPEWGASDSATWDVFSGNEPESWEPRHQVMARVSLSDPYLVRF
ncbi:hypothetical protein C0993_007656 [Termitomyces sp. T159_Od127]|nr:hypothetical protein C0993_007656 [Termitomyces sp. T159_Od127]